MSDTPRTDEVYFAWREEAGQALEAMYEHACKLERELASESRVIEGLAELYGTTPENLRGVAEGTYS